LIGSLYTALAESAGTTNPGSIRHASLSKPIAVANSIDST